MIKQVSFVVGTMCLAVLFACKHVQKAGENGEASPVSDYFFRQRAFPFDRINEAAYREAMLQARQMREQVSERNSTPWTFAGPTNIGGRIASLAIHPSDMQTIFLGTASGGVFKTSDGGASWMPVFDEQPSLSIGNVAIAPTNPQTVYVGTGEANCGGGSQTYDGVGIFKSVDGGDNWVFSGLESVGNVGRIAIDPENENRVFVAAMGNLYGNDSDRGIYRSTNGGDSWQKVLFVNDSTGGIDLCIHPQNPDTVYAATWQRIRRPWRRQYGGPGCGIYRSVDGGDNWQKLANGLPTTDIGRIGLSISPVNPNVLFAIYADESGDFKRIYSTQNGGNTWVAVDDGSFDDYSTFGWWFGRIVADPVDVNRVYAMGLNLWRSDNGGISWQPVGDNMHVDQHDLFINPANNQHMVAGNDGGAYVSFDDAQYFEKFEGLPITQFYTAEIDFQYPERLSGGAQDNGTWRSPDGGIDNWDYIFGGDGFVTKVDPVNNNYVYAEYQYGALSRSSNGGNSFMDISSSISGRKNWNTPYLLDPANPQYLYYGTQRVHKSINRGNNWTGISPDLSNGPGSNIVYGTVSTIDVSVLNSDIIWAGTDDGNVWRTLDGGNNWLKVSATLPQRWVTRVVTSPHDEQTAYVTLSGYRFNEWLPHVFKTTDAGASWQPVSGNLPDVSVNDLIISPVASQILYIATDAGAFVSYNDGDSWEPLGIGLPNVPVTDLVMHTPTQRLVAATYGRSMYLLDLLEVSAPEVPGGITDARVSPNPVTGREISLQYQLDVPAEILIELFTVDGRRLQAWSQGKQAVGSHTGEFDIRAPHAAGTHYLRISAGKRSRSLALVLSQ